MKKVLLVMLTLSLSISGKSQMSQSDLLFYVGSGPDTAVIVIDFLDGTADSSYAWGYLFDATSSATGGDALAAIVAEEPQITIATGGGFLNDITYNSHIGIGGAPDFWGTWSKTASTAWASNTGLGEILANGDWFGCSYTDFGPAIEPGDSYPAYNSTWFAATDVDYWVGSGSDTAIMVIDFVTAIYGEQVSYAWGYLFNGSTDGATMMTDISNHDANLEVATGGGFLNDIYMNDLTGEAGMPHYWGTWSGTNLSDWTLNAGLATSISNGDWFGATYDAWEPRRPFAPSAAQDSAAFTVLDIPTLALNEYFVGNGNDTAVFVFDFNQGPGTSYAIGYAFDATANISAEVALTEMAALSDILSVAISGGFLNDIVYNESGIGGSPNYWSTWTAVNNGGWYLNTGISEILADGTWFGCSYTDFSPATFPTTPSAAPVFSRINENEMTKIDVYPNPTNSDLTIESEVSTVLQLFDLNGRLIKEERANSIQTVWTLNDLDAGIYQLISNLNGEIKQTKVIRQ